MAYNRLSSASEAEMAPLPQDMVPNIQDAFTADRVMFWQRFTGATKGAVIVMVLFLLAMLIFLV